jgi:hypothetical protein
MKSTKTWKIGEYAKGGVISVEIESTFRNGNVITIIGKEWDSSQGYKKNSNQSNAKEFIRTTIHSSYDSDAERKMFRFLNELTTSYYVGNIIEWIKTKIK